MGVVMKVRTMLSSCMLCCLLLFVCGSADAIESLLSYRLPEEEPVDTYIGSVIRDSGIFDQYSTETLSKTQVSVTSLSTISGDAVQEALFKVDEKTGSIRTAVVIDRETVCSGLPRCVFVINTLVDLVRAYEVVIVQISIEDINDNSPYFSQSVFTLSLSEGSMIGTSVSVPSAVDKDSPRYGIQNYRLISNGGLFRVDYTTQTAEVHVILAANLDREQKAWQAMQLIALDGGDPPRAASMVINITILDINDQAPTFLQDSYSIRIPEDHPYPSELIQVKATDPDSGRGGEIQYTFSANTAETYGELFHINSNNPPGMIYLTGSLDHEEQEEYLLSVVATDGGDNSLSSQISVRVQVTDVNDNSPTITKIPVAPSVSPTEHTLVVSEDAKLYTKVALLFVQDKDSGQYGDVTCTWPYKDEAFLLQSVYPGEYSIVTGPDLDREVKEIYRLTVTCTDQAQYPLSSTTDLAVMVKDVNDNPPVFRTQQYDVELLENTPPGVILVQVIADDFDLDASGAFYYDVLDATSRKYISVDSDLGVVTTKVTLDHEQSSELSLYVVAIDKGNPPLTGTAAIHISVLDTNDHGPTFLSRTYLFTVNENVLVGTKVGRVVAHDPDSSLHSANTYQMLRANGVSVGPQSLFQIDQETGDIYTNTELDRELMINNVFEYKVVARDPIDEMMYTECNVTITVAGVNDNAPVFTYPVNNTTQFNISPSEETGHKICTLKAQDADIFSHRNLTLRFSIEKGNEDGYFYVKPFSGEIITQRALTEVSVENFNLEVKVTDDGMPPLSSRVNLIIALNNSDTASTIGGFFVKAIVSAGTVICVISIIIFLCAIIQIRKRKKQDKKDASSIAENDKNVHKEACTDLALPCLVNDAIQGSSTKHAVTLSSDLYDKAGDQRCSWYSDTERSDAPLCSSSQWTHAGSEAVLSQRTPDGATAGHHLAMLKALSMHCASDTDSSQCATETSQFTDSGHESVTDSYSYRGGYLGSCLCVRHSLQGIPEQRATTSLTELLPTERSREFPHMCRSCAPTKSASFHQRLPTPTAQPAISRGQPLRSSAPLICEHTQGGSTSPAYNLDKLAPPGHCCTRNINDNARNNYQRMQLKPPVFLKQRPSIQGQHLDSADHISEQEPTVSVEESTSRVRYEVHV